MPRRKTEGIGKDRTTSKPGKAVKPTRRQKDAAVPDTKASFPIVGIGASAGGLEAFEKSFTHTPPDTGMAFVLIQQLDPKDSRLLQKIFILVRSQTGHDFSYYKQNTILRRIVRRMAVNQITRLSDYVRYMQDDPREAVILFKELLIGVTNFFRDKEAFEALRDHRRVYECFSVMDRKWKLFKRKDTDLAQRQVLDLHAPTATDRRVDAQIVRHGAEGTSAESKVMITRRMIPMRFHTSNIV